MIGLQRAMDALVSFWACNLCVAESSPPPPQKKQINGWLYYVMAINLKS